MAGVDPRNVDSALDKLADGDVFERFAVSFLSPMLGHDFAPVGGLHDRGVDGLERTFSRDGSAAQGIFQFSVESDTRAKIRRTLVALKKNDVTTTKLTYVTSRLVDQLDRVADDLEGQFAVPLRIFDRRWFVGHVNDLPQTAAAYTRFVDNYFHDLAQPGRSFEIADLEGDPRLYVFLRQLWDERSADASLETVVVDALILFSLEGTDPDAVPPRMRTRQQILDRVRELVAFDSAVLTARIDDRLYALSRKPRQIRHHRKQNAYVLPYETRRTIKERNVRDAALIDTFRSVTTAKLGDYLETSKLVEECFDVTSAVLHKVFSQQGLEFTNFVLSGEGGDAVEKIMPEIVSLAVQDSQIPSTDRELARRAIILTLRDAVYNGHPAQSEFLGALSRTYMMLFTLRCDPKLYVYFSTLASQLRIYVDVSVLVPAMSEYFLEVRNQRHANLLRGAHAAGTNLRVNRTILGELAGHFEMLRRNYEELYKGTESTFDTDEQIVYVDEIMLRAYFYCRRRGQVSTFEEFFNSFVSFVAFDRASAEAELAAWLKEEFGVEFVPDESLGIAIDKDDARAITEELVQHRAGRGARLRAQNDARMVLTIYGLRERDSELGEGGVFGYRTWWLSTDTTTGRAVRNVLGDRFPVSCYIRADFLNDFVALGPGRAAVEQTFREMFPNLTGVSMSFHLPEGAADVTKSYIREHGRMKPAAIKAALGRYTQLLKTNPDAKVAILQTFFDEELQRTLPRTR